MGQINGPQRAKVMDVNDPDGLLRVSVRVLGLWDGIAAGNLPWAERLMPDDGSYTPLLVGDLVWVDFPYSGDSTRPRVVGRSTDAPGGVPNVSAEASGQGAAYVPKVVDGAPSAGAITTGKDYVYDRNGLLEIRNASGSWSVTHKASGSTMGMNDSGEMYMCSQLSIFVSSVSDVKIKSGANIALEAVGNVSIKGAKVNIDKT